MEERSSKVIAIVALCIGVIGLSLGFAAFSAQLTVESGATVTVDQDSQFKNVFGYAVEPAPTGGSIASKYAKAWTGITYEFTAVGETKTYTATIVNDSDLVAYLETASTPTVTSCNAVADAEGNTISDALKTAACGEIKLTVNAPTTIAANDSAEITVTITGPTTPVDGNLAVVFSDVTLDYTTAQPTTGE